MSINLST